MWEPRRQMAGDDAFVQWCYTNDRVKEAIMGTRIKPVQPTEIRDIKIVREAIAQIRKPIPPEVEQRLREMAERFDRTTRK
jgi:hypothetical protein